MKIECVLGDITQQQDCQAIANAANNMLLPGAGIAGAIQKAAGRELEKYCEQYAPIEVGQAVISPGFNLVNPLVIHVLGPKYFSDVNPEENLGKAIRSTLAIANENQVASLALR